MHFKSPSIQNPLIGIIGGTGPESTILMQKQLLEIMKKRLKPLKDQDYYGVIVDNNPQIIDRTVALKNNDKSIVQLYIKRARDLEHLGVNLIIISCNTAHAFFDKIQSALSIKILNLIEETVLHFVSTYPSVKIVGLLATLGTLNSKIYQEVFSRHGVKVIVCDEDIQLKVHQAIYGIKAGYTGNSLRGTAGPQNLYKIYKSFDKNLTFQEVKLPKRIISDALENIRLKSPQVQHIILGCTELPIICKISQQNYKLIDPNKIIAESSVKYFNKNNS